MREHIHRFVWRRWRDAQALTILLMAIFIGDRELGLAFWRFRHVTSTEAAKRLAALYDVEHAGERSGHHGPR